MMMYVMMNFWPVIGVLLVGMVSLVLFTDKPKWNDYLAFSVIVGAYLAAWIILHPRQTPLIEDAQTVQAMIGSGTPVLLEFQSPY